MFQRKVFAGIAFAVAVSATSGAWAQNCSGVQTGTNIPNIGDLVIPSAAAASAISGAIGNVNTAFLTQQGSAFVSAPPNPVPDQPGGGVWIRGVGGNVTLKNTSNSNSQTSDAGGVINTTQTTCNTRQRQDFAGVQIGADIAKLNWNGWNVHLGTTAGYLGSRSTDNNQFTSHFEVPFIGTYLVATHGRFFADLMVRQEYYNISLQNGTYNYFNQPIGAHGISVSTSAGYNFALANNWFIEPSAGFVWSRTKVDDFTNSGSVTLPIGGTVSTNDITSEIGRLSLRAGTVIATPTVIWQPFASASVFHEFAGNVVSNYTTLPNNAFIGVDPVVTTQQTATSRIGTYGQYSLGVAAQFVNTGWLGFLRVDYRNGSNIDGWSGNAGIRYQFSPEMIAAAFPTKAPVKAMAPVFGTSNWTGFYLGAFAGVDYGRTDIRFVNDVTSPGGPAQGSPHVFGPLGGGTFGYNYQLQNNFLLGIEGDIGAGNISGARTCGNDPGLNILGAPDHFSPAYYTCKDKVDWVATVAARIGYAWGRTLYYVKGGAAFEHSTASFDCILGPTGMALGRQCSDVAGNLSLGANTSGTRTGWTAGFGTEFDLGKGWSAKTEYDYIDFGSRTSLASDGITVLREKTTVSQVKVGVNYRFSSGGAVVARY